MLFTVSSSKPADRPFQKQVCRSSRSSSRRVLTCRKCLQRIVEGVCRLLRAAVERLHLKGLDLPAQLQVKHLDVSRQEGLDADLLAHGVADVGETCEYNGITLTLSEDAHGRPASPPFASEQTARKPSSVRSLNKGRTP